ncbi:Acyl protein synthase/acyl-CoA reductase RfbN [Aequoribacter fuscus]|uniref:Acyl protein synthase/acyl-CoA reductase RfbN n=1 Tax=Aequoribacter fuscus TaxID=2518989 RepID=F3L3Q3_9GAMM|nr:Acyl protein synthase/acyl-CoA reductase RfbN [Aequoribacter fuscus]EGG29026.1 Acyl protein synthase/acyl-CoA reductase RfbN [Aequoribacter fuscus]QHJ88880.1 acyl-protein synthetase [Aequoribacter fuscus]
MDINERVDNLFFENPYSLNKSEKRAFILDILGDLHIHHSINCEGYRRFVEFFDYREDFVELSEYPYLPVRLFKNNNLLSISKEHLFKTLNSSGTTGSVSKIYLNKATASRQSKVLNKISSFFIGNKRIPMCIIDSKELLQDRTKFNARAAGIIGYSVFGRDHFYCLDQNLDLKVEEFIAFIKKYEDEPIFFFGFTFLIWSKLIERLEELDFSFVVHPDSLMIHGGGWKKLVDLNISNETFKKRLNDQLKLVYVYNYYGMIEQVGSVFMECSAGMLHASNYSDILIRDKSDYAVLDHGKEGLIQVISILPTSYPGNSILTEDVGVLYGEDDCSCGLNGKYFKVNGRLPQAELRGCSDTRKV